MKVSLERLRSIWPSIDIGRHLLVDCSLFFFCWHVYVLMGGDVIFICLGESKAATLVFFLIGVTEWNLYQLIYWNLFRMKRGALKRSARHISVVLVVLVCATVGIWTWDSNPTMAFLPRESQILKLETGLTMTLKLLFLPHQSKILYGQKESIFLSTL